VAPELKAQQERCRCISRLSHLHSRPCGSCPSPTPPSCGAAAARKGRDSCTACPSRAGHWHRTAAPQDGLPATRDPLSSPPSLRVLHEGCFTSHQHMSRPCAVVGKVSFQAQAKPQSMSPYKTPFSAGTNKTPFLAGPTLPEGGVCRSGDPLPCASNNSSRAAPGGAGTRPGPTQSGFSQGPGSGTPKPWP